MGSGSATVISLFATIIHKWIFEARTAYGGIVREKIAASGVPELAQSASSLTGSMWSFLGRWKLVIFALIALYLNLSFALSYRSATSTEYLGWVYLFYFYPCVIANITFFFGVIVGWFKHNLTAASKVAAGVMVLSVAALFVILYTPVDYGKNVLAQKEIVQGTLTGSNVVYDVAQYGLRFTYPKDWNLIIAFGVAILITPQKDAELQKVLSDRILSGRIGLDVHPMHVYGDKIQTEIQYYLQTYPAGHVESGTSYQYAGEISVNGQKFPYFTGVTSTFYSPSGLIAKYFLIQHNELFEADCTIAPERGVTEEACRQIITSLEFK